VEFDALFGSTENDSELQYEWRSVEVSF
jgi:hypothetical protein